MKINEDWANGFFSAINEENILKRRESNTTEFKEIFDWKNKEFKSNIARTAAAFSNREGGVIIFGVADRPHIIVGIDDYDSVDDADISVWFNELFSPSIEFVRREFKIGDLIIGILQIFESKNKPIICIKDSAKTFDSDIYYRYSARSSKIKSGDLIYLLNEIKDNEKDNWLKFLSNITQVGIENIALLNSVTGELSSSNNTFLIDDAILSQIKILDKYSESHDGAPAVKIIGDVVDSAKVVEKTKNIFEEDIFEAFLTERSSAKGIDYISSICTMNSEMYPLYYFLNLDFVKPEERFKYVELIETRFKNRNRVLSRLSDDGKIHSKKSQYSLTSSGVGQERKNIHDKIISQEELVLESENDCKLVLETLFSLEKDDADIKYLKHQIFRIFESFYPFEKDLINFVFRWSLTYIDFIYYKEI
ncbi:ATP-binding protein [Vibrio rhizosphaerae]|uniref:ATP-binding protein n=1 Tax=Vibrio rhizosphaerae TaxID=398736 RepID=A0ABU4IQE0_9VIBR|nr:ATP-binding protein [Vibrio rhizosphaerae]MDW6091178.1 ATP-binding protein [Vibrio rhizosphaerae]